MLASKENKRNTLNIFLRSLCLSFLKNHFKCLTTQSTQIDVHLGDHHPSVDAAVC